MWCDGAVADIIERYLDAIASHDWAVVNECIADDIVRVDIFIQTPRA